jgi:hypothetical protein
VGRVSGFGFRDEEQRDSGGREHEQEVDEGLIRSGLLGLRVSRREALGRGLAGAAGLMLADRALLATATAAPPLPTSGRVAKAKSVIQVFLWGGMSHTDTWDPKPDAGYDYTGQMKPHHQDQRGGHAGQRAGSPSWPRWRTSFR